MLSPFGSSGVRQPRPRTRLEMAPVCVCICAALLWTKGGLHVKKKVEKPSDFVQLAEDASGGDSALLHKSIDCVCCLNSDCVEVTSLQQQYPSL